MKPTQEQVCAIRSAMDGKTFKISAYAGSGKTSTLKLISGALNDQKGLYLAFNRAIADDAQSKFPRNVKCQTFHSLAFRQTPDYIKEKLGFNRLLPRKMGEIFDLRDCKLPLNIDDSKSETCTVYDQAMILNRAIGLYCRSTEQQVTSEIVLRAMPDWVHKPSCLPLVEVLVGHANSLWEKYIDQTTRIKITHDVYLKNWAMGNPEIQADFILFDEAQDADPIMLDVLNKQPAQVIYVGDKHQQIYAFRGAVNAMQSLKVEETKLTKSFRFGGDIALIANMLLKHLLNEPTVLVGNDLIPSMVCKLEVADAYLARTNAGAFTTALQLVKDGRRPKLEIDVAKLLSQVEDAEKLQTGIPINKNSDFYGFSDWSEVLGFVQQNEYCDIAPLVALIENNGTDFLIPTLKTLKEVDNNDCTVSTAHKSKGLEFKSVKLCSDFFWNFQRIKSTPAQLEDLKAGKDKMNEHLAALNSQAEKLDSAKDEKEPAPPEKLPLMSEGEARLFYVACTRAINFLDISDMKPFFTAFKSEFSLHELALFGI